MATYKSRSPSVSMSASVMDMLPAVEARPDSAVISTNLKLPSLRKSLVPLPSAFTSRSRSASPSTSANAAAVESWPMHATPALPVMSSNVQFPLLRYSLFPLSSPQKYRSHHPSPSISPAATPDPLSRLRLRMDRSLSSWFANPIPDSTGGTRLNPVLPFCGTSSGALCKPSPSFFHSRQLPNSTKARLRANKPQE